MLDKRLLEEILAIAVSTGADFAEIFCEKTRNGNIQLLDGKIDSITDNTLSGVGIRAFLGVRTVYASTSDVSREGLTKCARSVAAAFSEMGKAERIRLSEGIVTNVHPVRILPTTAEAKYKCDLLKEACLCAKEYDSRIAQVSGALLTVDRRIPKHR